MSSTYSVAGEDVASPSQPTADGFPLSHRLCIVILLVLSAVLYVGNAARPALLDDADASHALVAREMLQHHDYVVMYMNGIRWPQKAPLHYWLVAAACKVLGESEFTTRLPVALAMIGLTLMLYEFGRHFFGRRVGFYAGLIVSTSVGMYIFTRIMIPEAIYALEFTAAFYLFLRAWDGSLSPRLGCWGSAVMIALAVLTRGLIGVVFPVGAMLGFVILTRGWKRLWELPIWSSIAIFLIIAVPWHVMAEWRYPGWAWEYFINEHFNRALGKRWPPDYDAVPLWLWLPLHLVWLFPWSVFAPFTVKEFPAPRTWRSLDSAGQARLMLFVWVVVILGFFSVLGGSRMEYYSFGCWPAMALLLGLGLARAEDLASRWLSRLQAGLAALGVAIAAALGYMVWQSLKVQSTGDISSLLTTNTADYKLSMGHMLDLTPAAFADLRMPAIVAGVSFLLGLGAAWILRRHGRALASSLAIAAGMVGFFFAANAAFGVFEPRMSSRQLAAAINQHLRPGDQIVIYGEFNESSSISYYTGRRAWIYNGRYNHLEYGSHAPDAPHIFLDDQTFPLFWRTQPRAFLFVPPEDRAAVEARLPKDSSWLLIELGGKTVFTNQQVASDEPSLADAMRRK